MSEGLHLRAQRHGASLLIAVGFLAFLLAYAAVVSYFGAADAEQVQLPAVPESGVAITFVGNAMEPEAPFLRARVILEVAGDLLDDTDALREPIAILIEPSLDRELIYRASRQPEVRTVELPMAGNVQQYPFDSYRTQLRVTAWRTDGRGGLLERLPVSSRFVLRDPGWSGSDSSSEGRKGAILDVTVDRAASTAALSLMLLTFMVALAIVAALVAIWVISGIMEVQVGIASWLAALLFALIPLRNFLPGAPPVGAWIDVLVFFWVEVIVMSSMLGVVVTLLVAARRQDRAGVSAGAASNPPPDLPEATQGGAGGAEPAPKRP